MASSDSAVDLDNNDLDDDDLESGSARPFSEQQAAALVNREVTSFASKHDNIDKNFTKHESCDSSQEVNGVQPTSLHARGPASAPVVLLSVNHPSPSRIRREGDSGESESKSAERRTVDLGVLALHDELDGLSGKIPEDVSLAVLLSNASRKKSHVTF